MKGTTSVPRCAHSFSTHRYRCALILLLPSSSRKLTSAVYSTHGLPSVPIRPPCAPFVHFETDVYLTHRMSDGTLHLSDVLFLSLTLFFFGVKCAYLTVLSYLQCSFGTHWLWCVLHTSVIIAHIGGSFHCFLSAARTLYFHFYSRARRVAGF